MSPGSKPSSSRRQGASESNSPSERPIAGNAAPNVKEKVVELLGFFNGGGTGFGDKIGLRIAVTEVSVAKKEYEPQKFEGVVICEMTVEEDMVNGAGNLHGGCAAYLVDVCSTLPIAAYQEANSKVSIGGVSQVIDMVYHSPAQLGDKLKLISRTLAVGARSMSARCEIWNETHHRLVASGTHIKMEPSPAKASL
ncbi:hypothetical protein SCHPADRAFT_882727 [Schizopora paradoxa]|uniref:Thioesterase domain-containing protein n=1 Tax=Schizopora paradoxa TaxID=27342 RepID=A0A0H2R427_9AGAM|nr:hypothetical protein SCHPADRAFT_882727 [Schizopora paradoxa]